MHQPTDAQAAAPVASETAVQLAQCARAGEQLSKAPERDLAWHVMAYHVGDLSALVSTRLASTRS